LDDFWHQTLHLLMKGTSKENNIFVFLTCVIHVS